MHWALWRNKSCWRHHSHLLRDLNIVEEVELTDRKKKITKYSIKGVKDRGAVAGEGKIIKKGFMKEVELEVNFEK